MLSLIEPESLLVEIPVEMRRIKSDVGSLEGAFQEAPEILDVVGVHVAANKLDRVINHLMRIGVGKAKIRFESIGIKGASQPRRQREFSAPMFCGGHWERA